LGDCNIQTKNADSAKLNSASFFQKYISEPALIP